MNDFGFNDYNALFQQMYGQQKQQKDKAGWLDPALTAAGAIAGTMLMPGAGTAAGASLGHAAGGVAHSAVNGNTQGAMQGAMGLPAFWQQFAPYIGTFADGGPVTDQTQQQPDPMAGLSPELIKKLQEQASMLAGQQPVAPKPASLHTATHPTLEALATLMPTLLGSLPKPANPKNTKAIGAWAPFAGNVMAAPALIAQSRRKAANAPIEDANAQAQSDYEARQKAYEDQKKAYGTALIQGAMRPQKEGEQVISVELAQRYGHPEWAGMTESQVRLKLAGQPPKEKGQEPADPIKFRQYVRIRLNQDPNIKPFIKVRDSFNIIDRIARNATAASDMSMIFAYMKLLDPDSVVRESEYANAANARGVDDSIRVLWNGLRDGQRLSPAQRENFRREAMSIMLSRIGSLRDTVASYQGEAEMAGVDITPLLAPMKKYLDPNYENTLNAVPSKPTTNAAGLVIPSAGNRRQ